MKPTLLVSTLLFATLASSPVKAQLPYSTEASYEMAASELRSAPARQYNFSKAVMSDIMRLMAEDAGIGRDRELRSGLFAVAEGDGPIEVAQRYCVAQQPADIEHTEKRARNAGQLL